MGSSNQKSELLYDTIRKKWVEATPEEVIRQRLVRRMVDELGYLPALIAIEKELAQIPSLQRVPLNEIPKRRADIIVFAPQSLSPLLLIECKAVRLTRAFAQQVIGYNDFVGAPHVALANEKEVLTGAYDPIAGVYHFERRLPAFNELMLMTEAG